MQIFKFNMNFLSPVHIGSGEEIDPLNYIVSDKFFYRINLEKLIYEMKDQERKELINLIENKRYIELRKFISLNCNVEKYSFYKTKISKNFKNIYSNSIGKIENTLTVNSFIRSNNFKAYIPGSSIKGSIRTALLNYYFNKDYKEKNKDIIQGLKLKNKWINGRNIENEILHNERSDPKLDPFRAVFIQDLFFQKNNEIFIGHVINRRLKNGNLTDSSESWQMFYEVTGSVISNPQTESDDFSTDHGEIRINELLENKVNFNYKIDMSDIRNSCNKFYKKIAEDEYNKFFRKENNIKFDKLLELIDGTEENQFILRIGKFSHIESMTLDNFEKFKPRRFGNSRNLLEGRYPLGWVKITYKK